MLSPALFSLGGAFFFLILRVQGADGCFPRPLSPEKEAELLRRMQQDNDEQARALLIEHNLRLVAHIVKKYYAASSEQDDLLSIGTIGLIKAVNTFRPDKNIRLATYASKCIQNELLMHFRQKRKSAGEPQACYSAPTKPWKRRPRPVVRFREPSYPISPFLWYVYHTGKCAGCL